MRSEPATGGSIAVPVSVTGLGWGPLVAEPTVMVPVLVEVPFTANIDGRRVTLIVQFVDPMAPQSFVWLKSEKFAPVKKMLLV